MSRVHGAPPPEPQLTSQPWLTKDSVPPPRPAPLRARLEWTPHDTGHRLVIERLPQAAGWLNLGDFSAALRAAKLFDNTAVDLPGAIVALPAGASMVSRFCSLVRQQYESAGLAEYDYPSLSPLAALDNFNEVFDARERALFVGTADDFRRGQPRGVLLPTGEPIIYSHWQKMVRSQEDLPIEMFRHATFFRPWSSSRRGRHIFNALEGVDTFEFHCCYQPSLAHEGASRLFAMLRGLAASMAVPVLWSTRPPWSNHSSVSLSTIGGDVPLPSGATLQIGTLYRQGRLFSSRFGIRYRSSDGERLTPEHVTGALSRRLLLTHLCLGMVEGGGFAVHPALAPVQARVLVRPTEYDAAEAIVHQTGHLWSGNARVVLESLPTGAEAARRLRQARQVGEPLTLLLQGRRSPDDRTRVVLRRGDTLAEVEYSAVDFGRAPDGLIDIALADLVDAHEHRIAEYFWRRVVETSTVDEVREALAARLVAAAPMEFSAGAHDIVSQWGQGEILGYVQRDEDQPCVLSDRTCTTRAYLSPRA